ncbi:2-amino-4-hydroxy-6-hydroxymethyldihydropteridine diphosphokinase [Lysinibacillus odysseyi]|uniref:2-amino-4-hydroxy-6-hydroxymethyldihydropteridine diphosphokinase n=1 Tax=Lysinibacillus odysseyi 34hs-1 = NBRC 100172 TaxID=1220589 RepID=A0A0A3IWT8_9BACI|nr:2-amino-4-hydroxy-6-hydroxymethyldihydropteridine diphosphokinase [Lysinibacillus odysseyi]KGR87915.1 2-amino-4-hydroxy-6-hydroxymethyldihydropteridine pyrophosphokinase [Lysinibacillus odysseyi 34hs-1 = NBRC 100172]
MNTVYLSIGTNMGDREANLKLAVKLLMEAENITVEEVSSVYETAPVGFTDQAAFLNIAVRLTTDLPPDGMLRLCQKTEQELGRIREFRWGPRIIDLDILLYNQENIETDSLIVPHERMFERAFVLVPLMEISTPATEQLRQAHEALASLDIQKEGVVQWKKSVTAEEFVRSGS